MGRTFVSALSLVLLLYAVGINAQTYPTKPIRFVVPFGSVGVPDLVARVIATRLGENVGWQVVVDNRPGAGGIIAAQIVAKAPADGYTLFVSSINHLAVNPALYPKLPYDPLKDFTPVTLAVRTPLFLVVNASLPVHSLKDFIAYVKANPGLPYGSSGNGSQHQLGMELLKQLAGVNMTHVPYKGVAQSVPALVTGEIGAALLTVSSVGQNENSGKVRMIAVAEAKRSPLKPNVPTIAESGFPGYEISPEIGIVAPAGTPKTVIEKLSTEISRVLKTPEVVHQLSPLGIDPVGSTPEQYAETLRPNIEKYAKLVKMSRATVD